MQRDGRSAKTPVRISQQFAEFPSSRDHPSRTHNAAMPQRDSNASKGTHRLRKGRKSLEQQVYHVTTATRNRATLFSSLRPARCVVHAMMRIEKSLIADTWAYVVMPDHIHWLIQLRRRSSLSACVGSMKSQVATSLKKRLPIHGEIWQRGFHDHAIRRDENLVSVARYLIANPLRAGLVTEIGDYPHWDSIWI